MIAVGCPGLDAVNPVCQVGSAASGGFQSVLGDIGQWVASGAEWLLTQVGLVLTSSTTIDVGAAWFGAHYGAMSALAGVIVLPLLLLSTLQAVLRRDAGQLFRCFLVQLPLALLLAAVAVQVVVLCLAATDAMSDAVAGGTGADVSALMHGLTSGLGTLAADPTIASFVLLLLALLVAVAAFVLWLELLIRAAAVYVAVLFLPLALATLVWPAVSHWCRRLVETLAALILSKFVIVATLSLAAGAVSSGTAGSGSHGSGFSAVLAGGALLLIATFAPFAILKMIPAFEAGAVGHLEGLRQRATGAMTRPARSAVNHALDEGLQARRSAQILAGSEGAAASEKSNEEMDAEAAAKGNRDNGYALPGHDGMAIGESESPGIVDDYESGRRQAGQPRAKPPKPLAGWTPEDKPARLSPEERRASYRPTGPERPEDAWMWQGVPEGKSLVGKPFPGSPRFYRDEDEQGPRTVWLPAAWPPGEEPDGRE